MNRFNLCPAGNQTAGESKQLPPDMQTEKEDDEDASPEEYVALSNFTGSGNDQVRDPHRRRDRVT